MHRGFPKEQPLTGGWSGGHGAVAAASAASLEWPLYPHGDGLTLASTRAAASLCRLRPRWALDLQRKLAVTVDVLAAERSQNGNLVPAALPAPASRCSPPTA